MFRRVAQFVFLTAVLFLFTVAVGAQVAPTGTLTGVVTDPQGNAVPGATVTVVDEATGTTFPAITTGAQGEFTIGALNPGSYTVTIKKEGFKQGIYKKVKIVVSEKYDLQAKLEVGEVATTVVVEAGQEVIQTQSAQIGANITGKSITQLPWSSRNVLDLAILMPGAATSGQSRQTSFEGLPKGAMNITYDGINVQDNLLKSNDGFFTIIRPSTDAVEEFSIATAGNGADQNGEGAVQIHFETKRGGNAWHGGGWEYLRNDYFNANYYFNNEAHPQVGRQVQRLNQYGGKIGGPILKDKLFFFADIDDYSSPLSRAIQRTILAPAALGGNFTYAVSAAQGAVAAPNAWTTCTGSDARNNGKATCTANLALFSTAMGIPSPATNADPFVANLLSEVNAVRSASGVGLLANPTPYLDNITFNTPGTGVRRFPDFRLDWNVSKNHSIEYVYHYSHFTSTPDLLNGFSYTFPVAPFNKEQGSQISNRYEPVIAWRWNVTSTMSNELRFGLQSSLVSFFPDQAVNFYPSATTNLGAINLRPLLNGIGISQPFLQYATQGRNTPLAQLIDNFTWSKGTHSLTFGTNITDIRFHEFFNNPLLLQALNVGLSSADPASNVFTLGNFPGIGTGDLGAVGSLWAALVGHVTSESGSIAVNPSSRQFQAAKPFLLQAHQHEWGVYFTDAWRYKPSFTLTYGLRWDYEGAPADDFNEFFSGVGGLASAFGPSGLNNLFQPGTQTGAITSFQLNGNRPWWTPQKKNFAPNVGFAWQPNFGDNKWLGKVFGGPGKTVLRAVYSIAYTREGFQNFLSIAPSNPGVTGSIFANAGSQFAGGSLTANSVLTGGTLTSLTTSPATFPSTGTFAITPFANQSINTFASNLRTPYVQSWSFGIQRELSTSTVLEVRYVGNHSVALWRQDNLNEVNIFENGFLQEFKNAFSNLSICSANFTPATATGPATGPCAAAQTAAGIPCANKNSCSQTGNSYVNWGLTGQVPLPIFTAAFAGNPTASTYSLGPGAKDSCGTNSGATSISRNIGCNTNWTSGTFVTPLLGGGAGQIANTLAFGNAGQFICNMVGTTAFGPGCPGGSPAAGSFPANFFVANPQATGGAFRFYNGSQSTYNALVVEMRRRPAKGLEFSGSYTFSKALSNYYANSSASFVQSTTLRNSGYDKGISPWNLTHQFKFNGIYEFPFGPGRKWNSDNRFMQRLIGGWALSGITRWQSGGYFQLTDGASANFTFNNNDPGVVLNGITPQQLQSQLAIRKTTNASGVGQVFYFPASLIAGNGTANTSIIAPCTTAGTLCNRIFLTGPGFFKTDLSMIKTTKITERVNVELRAEALNAFNNINFYYPGNAGTVAPTNAVTSTSFGQVTAAFQDPNGTDDNGGRILQLVFRINF